MHENKDVKDVDNALITGLVIGIVAGVFFVLLIVGVIVIPDKTFYAFQSGALWGCTQALEGSVAQCVDVSRSLD